MHKRMHKKSWGPAARRKARGRELLALVRVTTGTAVFLFLSLASLSLTLTSCGGGGDLSPCDGHEGVCLNVKVEGSVDALDQLAFTIEGVATRTVLTPTVPTRFELPVEVAVLPPIGATGTVQLKVTGFYQGQALAQSPAQSVTLPSTGHTSLKLKLQSPP